MLLNMILVTPLSITLFVILYVLWQTIRERLEDL